MISGNCNDRWKEVQKSNDNEDDEVDKTFHEEEIL